MATPVLIPVEEYLRTTYRPDCDYVDGEVKERNVGETPHATVQSFLGAIFLNNRAAWGVRPYTEQRVQVSAKNYRVADLCAVRLGTPPGGIIRTPPLICVEVLSSGQSLRDIEDRVRDYAAMGVENIWIIDPNLRKAWTASPSGIAPLTADVFTVPGTPIRIPLADIYAELDDMAAGR